MQPASRKHPLANCEACPLFENKNAFVPTEFAEAPKLVVVGEAPGYYETAQGRPFMGPSGQLLNKVLSHNGYRRRDITYTNVCLCRPEGNATPSKAAINACRPRLIHDIVQSGKAGAEDVLALGGTAASALIPDGRTITHLRVGPPKEPIQSLRDSGIKRVVPSWHPAYCVDPGTKILTADLRWVEAGSLEIGEELIGFDEYPSDASFARRKFKPTKVTGNERIRASVWEVETPKGVITCSGDHLWLARKRKKYYTPYVWIATMHLTEEYDLFHFIDPWVVDDTREGGYVAGFLDGEGWVTHPNGLGWAQNDGDVAEQVCKLVEEKGFTLTKGYVGNCGRYYMGGPRDSIRALGIFRPARLLPKANKLWERQCSTKAVPVVRVEPLGVGEVIALNTTERTYIAEGLLSHNCLRTADAFPALVSDISKLKDVKRNAWSPPRWKYFDDPAQARLAIRELRTKYDRLVVDIEVGIEKDLSFGHPNEYDLLCVGLAYKAGSAVVIGSGALTDADVLNDLRELLQNVKLIAHNGKFDLAGLYPTLGPLELWFDTMLASYCIDERPGNHGLKVLAVEKLGAPQYDLEIRKYVPKGGNYANIPRELLYKYNAYDVVCTWDLYEMFVPQLEKPGRWPYTDRPAKTLRDVHDFLVKASNQLMYLELNGITIDKEYQRELGIIFQERISKHEDALNYIVNSCWSEEAGDFVFQANIQTDDREIVKSINPRSPKQIKEFLASQHLLVDSTNVDTISRVIEGLQGDTPVKRFCTTLLLHRRQQKLYSTYVDGIRKRTYRRRVYTTYLLHGSTSGRLASRNPNLQNIVRDKDIRKQFSVSNPENVLIQCDYKNAELRVMATLAQDEYLRHLLSNPDPNYKFFNELSDQLYGVDNWDKEDYIRTKAFVYGIGYGREPYSIGLEFGMDSKEANRLYHSFMDLIPATATWQVDTRKRVLAGEDLVTPFGRRRRFYLITEQNKKDVLNEALSYLPQSTSSDICLSAAIDLRTMHRGTAFLRLLIHDAIVAETHKDKAEQVIAMMQEVMMAKGSEFTDYVPFPVDVSVGSHWGNL